MVLLNVLKSVGIVDPVFTSVEFSGSFQCIIQFETDLPCAQLPRITKARIIGDVCSTEDCAEASAIRKAFENLDYKHNVRVVDISTHKTSVLNFKCRSVYSRVLDAIKCVEKML